MIVHCLFCNTSFNKKNIEVKKYPKHFCCRKHYFNWQNEFLKKPKKKKTCTNCGIIFTRRASTIDNKNSFCTRKCQYQFHRGKNAPIYKGGKRLNDHGYVLILCPKHPRRIAGQYVYEHTLVMEEKIKRYLKKEEVVHHINGIKNDNRIENLQLTNIHEHRKFHSKAWLSTH